MAVVVAIHVLGQELMFWERVPACRLALGLALGQWAAVSVVVAVVEAGKVAQVVVLPRTECTK